MADQHHRDALFLEPADQVEHFRHLPHADRRRRLVHQHDLGVGEPGAGDGHRLPLAARHAPHHVARSGLRLEFGEQFAGALVHAAIVEQAEAAGLFAAEEDIGGGRQIVGERQVLVDDLDALGARVLGAVQLGIDARDPDAALARMEIAGDDLDQRRLAGAVVAHQAHTSPAFSVKRHAGQRMDGAVVLGNILELENRHAVSSSLAVSVFSTLYCQ